MTSTMIVGSTIILITACIVGCVLLASVTMHVQDKMDKSLLKKKYRLVRRNRIIRDDKFLIKK